MTDDPAPELSAQDVLAIVEHELANVASVLVGLCSALERRWEQLSEQDRRALSQRIAAQAINLSTLLANLRGLRTAGSFAAGAHSPLLVRPADAIAAMVEDLRLAVPAHQLASAIDESLPPMRLDLPRLAQVLGNLVANAARSAPAGSKIALRAAAEGGALELTVEDSGPGIPPEQREAVFGKFVKLQPTGQGTGLGLFISRAIVEAMGGEIWLEEAPTGGCRARVRLPMPGG